MPWWVYIVHAKRVGRVYVRREGKERKEGRKEGDRCKVR